MNNVQDVRIRLAFQASIGSVPEAFLSVHQPNQGLARLFSLGNLFGRPSKRFECAGHFDRSLAVLINATEAGQRVFELRLRTVAGVGPGHVAEQGGHNLLGRAHVAVYRIHAGWFFLAAANVFVLLCLALIVSPLGRIRIGGRDATPDYSYSGWFAMLFAAGMGIGLMFYGVSEPISHYDTSLAGVTVGEDGVRTDWAPLGGAEDSLEARRLGMAATIFHWGLHPWAIYAIVALSLAIFSYNKGLPLTIGRSSTRSSASGSGAGSATSSTSSPSSPRCSGWPPRLGWAPSRRTPGSSTCSGSRSTTSPRSC
jgi:hypothetical protein